MPKARNPLTPVLTRTDDLKAQRNDKRITQAFDRASPIASGVVVEVTLAVGDNLIKPPMKHPQGVVVTQQSAAGAIVGLGMNDAGSYVLNSTVACTAKVSFH